MVASCKRPSLSIKATPRWLSSMPFAWYAILIVTVWWTSGFNMIIILAALQNIPNALYEAASIEGADWWAKTIYITIPQMKNVILFLLITGFVGAVQQYEITLLRRDGSRALFSVHADAVEFEGDIASAGMISESAGGRGAQGRRGGGADARPAARRAFSAPRPGRRRRSRRPAPPAAWRCPRRSSDCSRRP